MTVLGCSLLPLGSLCLAAWRWCPAAWCTCGLPLCVCTPPEPEPSTAPAPSTAPTSPAGAEEAPAAYEGTEDPEAASLFTAVASPAKETFPATEDGIRTAIKAKRLAAVEEVRVAVVVCGATQATLRRQWCQLGFPPLSPPPSPSYQILATNPALATSRDPSGQTMLHLACIFNLTDIALLLVSAGADTAATNSFGMWSPAAVHPPGAVVVCAGPRLISVGDFVG